MTYKATKPTVYIVHWPEIRVIKAGFSCNQRWRPFVLRGAVIVDLIEFDCSSDAFAFEDVVDHALRAVCEPAFRTAADAEPHLGGRGGGWLECYPLPEGTAPMDILTQADWGAA